MKEVDAQMVLKLHKMSGEPVANCHYLLTQTNGDYELALKILERILAQRREEGVAGDAAQPAPSSPVEALEQRVLQLELRYAQLADTLVLVNDRLSLLLDKVSGDQT